MHFLYDSLNFIIALFPQENNPSFLHAVTLSFVFHTMLKETTTLKEAVLWALLNLIPRLI